ncbi:HAD family hydrolase [Pikeienuella piscinae]|nr:HAD family hydrolase [Pikeienuella piscinae]
MIESFIAFFEARILPWETARRGRRHAAGLTPDDGGAITTLAAVAERLGGAKVVSFDLFDTLLLRRGLSPEATHRKTAGMARLIGGAAAGEAIFAARHQLSGLMKARMIAEGSGDEPPLISIFREALTGAGFRGDAAAAAARLVAFEAESEAQGIVAAPGVAKLLRGLRANRLKVIAVTDMYFHRPEIELILTRAGLRDLFDEVFVSADLGWTKRGGKIFPLVAGRLGVAPEDILHVGDRPDSDVAPARAAGWRALHYLDRAGVADTTAAHLAESYVPSPGLRRRRLAAAYDIAADGPLGAPERIVDQLVGPAVGLLALRALTFAQRRGAARLYHLTRDASIIGEIAEAALARHPHLAEDGLRIVELAINRALGARLQVRRAADLWRLGPLTSYIAKEPFSVAALARAFDLPESAFTGRLRGASGPELQQAFRDGVDTEPLLQALDAGRNVVETYLEAQGLLAAAPSVAVDIGYSGTFAVQLAPLLFDRPAPGRSIDFLFLMTSRYFNGNTRRVHPETRIHPGLVLDHRRRSSRWATWNFSWIEPFLVDPERGRLLGYEAGEPVFAPSPHDDATRAALLKLRARIRARALRFIDDFHGAPGDLEEVAALLQRRFSRFAGRPRRAEMRALRALAHQTGQVEIALRDPTRRVNPLRLLSELQDMKMSDNWTQGSLTRSGLGFVNAVMADRPERDRRADTRAMWD